MVKYILGIDPDKGWALVNRGSGRIISAGTVTGIEGIFRILQSLKPLVRSVKIRVELPSSKKVWIGKGLPDSVRLDMAEKVGENRAKAKVILLVARMMGFEVETCEPPGKISREYLELLHGYSERTSQHARDAIIIAMGKI